MCAACLCRALDRWPLADGFWIPNCWTTVLDCKRGRAETGFYFCAGRSVSRWVCEMHPAQGDFLTVCVDASELCLIGLELLLLYDGHKGSQDCG